MSYKVKTLPQFEKEAKKLSKRYHSFKKEIQQLAASLALEPTQGTPLGNNCYKIRMSITSKGKGKSGGARVVTNIQVVGGTVYLLSVYDKSDKENISNKEIAYLLSMIE